MKEKNIQLSNLSLLHLVEELKFLENGFINNIQTLENNWIKTKIHTKQFGDKQLILAPNLFFISNKSLPAKQNPGGYSAFLKKHLYNQRIISFSQLNLDRIIKIIFPNHVLIIELFAKGNIILCDKENKIIRAQKKEEWKDRKIEEGEIYKPPTSKGTNPLEETSENFFKKINQNEKTLFGGIVDILNISPQILEFVFEKNNLDKTQPSKNTTKTTTNLILEEIQKIYSIKQTKGFLNKNIIYPIQLTKDSTEFESINNSLNKLLLEEINQKILTKKNELIKETEKIEEKTKKDLRNLKNRETQIKQLEEKAINLQLTGEQIYLKYNEINELIKTIQTGKEKGYSSKEIKNKINSIKPIIKELNLEKNKLIINHELTN